MIADIGLSVCRLSGNGSPVSLIASGEPGRGGHEGLVVRLCYLHRPKMRLCNHCSDYLSPYPSLGSSNHGTEEHAFKHVRTAYVQFDSALPCLSRLRFLISRHYMDHPEHPLVDVDLFYGVD